MEFIRGRYHAVNCRNLLKIRDPIDLTPWGTSFMSCANSNPMKLGKNDGVHLVLPPGMFDWNFDF